MIEPSRFHSLTHGKLRTRSAILRYAPSLSVRHVHAARTYLTTALLSASTLPCLCRSWRPFSQDWISNNR